MWDRRHSRRRILGFQSREHVKQRIPAPSPVAKRSSQYHTESLGRLVLAASAVRPGTRSAAPRMHDVSAVGARGCQAMIVVSRNTRQFEPLGVRLDPCVHSEAPEILVGTRRESGCASAPGVSVRAPLDGQIGCPRREELKVNG